MPPLAGTFLVAKPVLKDPSFHQTVVFLLRHGAEGAFGLVVNRPAPVKGLPFPVFTGGPCAFQGLLMLHGHAEWVQESSDAQGKAVAPGIYLGDASCLERVSDPTPGQTLRFRMFTGYAGWGPGQLEGELVAGAWSIVPATSQLLFDAPVEDLWERLAPPTIPQPSLN
jgi:putative transcriptional regulator